MDPRSAVTHAAMATRDGKAYDLRHRNVAASDAQGAWQSGRHSYYVRLTLKASVAESCKGSPHFRVPIGSAPLS
jgi:hypothetical protein